MRILPWFSVLVLLAAGCGHPPVGLLSDGGEPLQGETDGGVTSADAGSPSHAPDGGEGHGGSTDGGSEGDAGTFDGGLVDAGTTDGGVVDGGVSATVSECSGSPVGFVTAGVAGVSMAMDSMGHPHLAYRRGALCYARWTGAEWDVVTVRPDGSFGDVAIALDGAGRARLAYLASDYSQLLYSEWNGTNWSHSTVDTGNMMQAPELAIDSSGTPHVAYLELVGGGGRPKYAKRTGVNWNPAHIDPGTSHDLSSISLALSSSGVPHVAFGGTQTLWYGRLQGTSWTLQQVGPAGSIYGAYPSLVLGPNDVPHISYRGSNGKLQLAKWGGVSWAVVEVDSATASVLSSALQLDASGHPHVVYIDHGTKLAKYARWQGGQWALSGPISPSSVKTSHHPHLRLTPAGHPIAAAARMDFGIQVYSFNGLLWEESTVGPVGYVEGAVSLQVPSPSRYLVAFRTSPGNLIKLAEWNGTRWELSTVTAADTSPRLVVDSSGTPHLAFAASGRLMFGPRYQGVWTFTAVDSAANPSSLSVAMDSSNRPHIAYYSPHAKTLKYATPSASGWSLTTVDTGLGSSEPSIALDASGVPHIAYSDYGTDSLKYANFAGLGWAVSTVQTANGGSLSGPSLALDSAGRPNIAYLDGPAKALKVARWTGSWLFETIDANGGSAPSLVMAPTGNMRVTYYDNTNQALKMGFRSPQAWTLYTLDVQGESGTSSSLQEVNGAYYIAYTDPKSYGFKFHK